jgi:hypothetical protein
MITLRVTEKKPLTGTRGKSMDVPPCTGFGFYVSGSPPGGIARHLMSGAEAMKAENIITLFEQLKGRKATPEEIANVGRTLKAPDV